MACWMHLPLFQIFSRSLFVSLAVSWVSCKVAFEQGVGFPLISATASFLSNPIKGRENKWARLRLHRTKSRVNTCVLGITRCQNLVLQRFELAVC
ncbi:hypothetical protein PpBr36_00662 [Pyricularia pennisetigena]|uniref:hypothetical protein n=1 Tax=Pyricularia pennisetigena TaxID=1578925 RepID=UPI001154EB62|nr:hypothetical protein PpBr36_00662 [Pyricularia pennisetigena]TLS29591.1 hypothetical protein PpBr36_00662 [Pyricularia pennisetigena]